jgi:hypothetical protein
MRFARNAFAKLWLETSDFTPNFCSTNFKEAKPVTMP